MPTVEVNGVSLAYDDAGAGPVVVLAHSAAGDRRLWNHQFADLSRDHRVIRYDWRGYGESGDASGAYAHYRDLLGLLDALEIGRAALVGCSMGGAWSLDVTLAAPERVTGLVLVCSGLSGHVWPQEMIDFVRAELRRDIPADRLDAYARHDGVPVDPADVRAAAYRQASFLIAGPGREPSAVDPAAWQLGVEMLERVYQRGWGGPAATELNAHPPAKGRLDEVSVPTLVVSGVEDATWLRQASDLLSAGIPGAERIDLPDTGHLPPLEHPANTTRVIRDFLVAKGI
jgi:pimeloyl-ACP methyl ester carboxylesterase